MLLSSFFISPLVDGLLLLAAAFVLLWITYHFIFRKLKKSDEAQAERENTLMKKIDEAFPKLERILEEGLEIKAKDESGEEVVEPRRIEHSAEDKKLMVDIAITEEIAEQTAIDFNILLGGVNTDGLGPEEI